MPVYYFIFGWTVFWGCIANMTARQVSLGEDKYRFKVNIFIAILHFLQSLYLQDLELM